VIYWRRYRNATEWFQRFEVPFGSTTNFTHSPLRGGMDPSTRSGQISVPGDPNTQQQMAQHIAALYDARQCATLVEMSSGISLLLRTSTSKQILDGQTNPGLVRQIYLCTTHMTDFDSGVFEPSLYTDCFRA
jgi:hypothetical protein